MHYFAKEKTQTETENKDRSTNPARRRKLLLHSCIDEVLSAVVSFAILLLGGALPLCNERSEREVEKRNHYDVSRQKAVMSPQEIRCFYSIPLLDNVMDEEHN